MRFKHKNKVLELNALSKLGLYGCVGVSLTLLSGCTNSKDDLDEYFQVERQKQPIEIAPIPEVKPYLRYAYPEHEKDPFDSAMLAPNTVREQIIDTGISIDTTRVPEFLEGFPLDSLKMVGTVEKDKTLWALIKIPDGAVQTVKSGNYLGQNFGKIVQINEVNMDMKETVSNGLGGYKERDISITLNQE
ncbi:MAG: pilus assembly protein PilP [Cocleimonas sp.]